MICRKISPTMVKSNFFILWTNLIFKNNSNKAIKLIKLFFDDKMNYQNKFYNKKLQNLAILSNNLFLRFYFDKLSMMCLNLYSSHLNGLTGQIQ